MIAITNTDRKATIAIAIGDFFSDGDRDRDRNFAIGVMSWLHMYFWKYFIHFVLFLSWITFLLEN